jgi:hypothetical protein
MTDALSAIERDRQISEAERSLFEAEKEFLRRFGKPTKTAKLRAEEIMKNWIRYTHMGSGYSGSPSKGLAKRHVLALNRWSNAKISSDELQAELVPLEDKSYHYFAVGGHGRIMNDPERIITLALKRKYGGETPHSFNAIVDQEGNITLEALTCKDCPMAAPCSISNRCNGYQKSEYTQAEVKRIKDRKEYQEITSELSAP